MSKTIAILGRQPALGRAELESIYGAAKIEPFGDHCLIDGAVTKQEFKRLGGSIRVGKIVAEISATNWKTIEKNILSNVDSLFPKIEGKLSFGVSIFGIKASGKDVSKTALLLKKSIKATGQSVRMVPQKGTELNAATVLYNKLSSEKGVELLVVSNGEKTLIGYTTAIQDIDAYAARDHGRPMRDAKVGMLPPKLAQIIINLGIGQTEKSIREKHNRAPLILDAFCGTGVILQEAMLMDYDIYGTDLEPRMVEYSIANLKWLDELYPDVGDYRRIEIGDAATFKWYNTEKIDVVAGETYLGQPLSALPPGDQLSKIMQEVNNLHHKFLENIGPQLPSGTRLCLAIPTWRGKYEFLHLSTLDYLADLGYTRMRFEHAENEDLIYHRENQVVGRELLVLTKN
jgi:tRNA G10  N-methylase Trm11